MISSAALVDWLLEGLELDASLFHVGRYCGGWHASTQGMGRASFHLVVQGDCWLHLDGQAQPDADQWHLRMTVEGERSDASLQQQLAKMHDCLSVSVQACP